MNRNDLPERAVGAQFNPYPQWILLGGVLLMVGAILISHFYTAHARIWANERARLGGQAEAMRHNIEYQLAAVHNVLMDIRDNLALHVLSVKPGKGMQNLSTQSLMAKLSIMPGVRTLGVVDRNGVMVASSRESIIGRNFVDRDYYLAPRAGNDSDTMYVAPPFSVRPGDAWTVSLSHAVIDSAGEFQGSVFAALDRSFFSTLLSSMNYAPDMWAAIAHGNGRQFMMTPDRDGMSGLDLSKPGSFFTRHRDSGNITSIMTGRVLATGDERIMALQTINPPEMKLDWPLVLGTGRTLEAVFAMWKKDLRLSLMFYTALVLASVVLLYLYQRRIRSQIALNNALNASLQASAESLARYNQELEQFAGVVSHDLRQPIAMISNYLELLRVRFGEQLDPEAEEMVMAAERGAHRLDAMLQGLLEYARTGQEEQPVAAVLIMDVINDVKELLHTEIKQSRASVICSATAAAVTIRASRDDLLRLFMNLISNAIKYRKPDVDPVIELDAVITQDGYIFTLKDNGAGFEPAQSERLFKMFGRLHAQSDYPGSGVGLAICRKIVDLYQGEITIESVGAGSGATVRFSLKNGCRQNPTIG